MSESEISQGKRWVEERLQAATGKAGIRIGETAWGQAGDDFTRGTFTLKFKVADEIFLERFSDESLEDCPNDRSVRMKLVKRLLR